MVYEVYERLSPWLGRQQKIINQAELLAAPLLTFSMPDLLADANIIWFIDNKSAESALKLSVKKSKF